MLHLKPCLWQKVVLFSWLLIVGFILFFCFKILFFSEDFASFSKTVTALFSASYLIDEIDKNYLNESNFQFFKTTFWFWVSFVIVIFVSLFLLIRYSVLRLNPEGDYAINQYNRSEISCLCLMFGLWLLFKIWLVYTLPIQIDELFDYQYFAKSNLITRHCYQFCNGQQWYNTQMMYSNLVAIFYKCGLPLKLTLKLPSILGEFLMYCLIVRRMKFSSFLNLCFVLFCITTSFWIAIYSVEARSYLLMTTCGVGSFIILTEMINRPYRSGYYEIILLNCFGFELCKLYMFPYVGMLLYFLRVNRNRNNYGWFLTVNTSVILATFLFYFPVVLLSGMQSVFQDIHEDFVSEMKLYPIVFETLSVITNVNEKSYLAVIVIISVIFFFRKQQTETTSKILQFLLAQIVSMVVLTLLFGMYMPPRLFLYVNCILWLYLSLLLFDILNKNKWKHYILLLFSVLLVFNFWFNFQYSWARHNSKEYVLGIDFYKKIENTIEIIKSKKPKSVFVPDSQHFLGFYAKEFLDKNTLVFLKKKPMNESIIAMPSMLEIPNYDHFYYDDNLDLHLYLNHDSTKSR